MICASLYRPFFIVNLLRYLAEKILLLNTTNFRGDYQIRRGGFVTHPLLIAAGRKYVTTPMIAIVQHVCSFQ